MTRILILIFIALIRLVYSHKILVYNPTFGYSHVTSMGGIADILAKAEFSVTVLQPIQIPTESTGSSIARVIQLKPSSGVLKALTSQVFGNLWLRSSKDPFGTLELIPMLSNVFRSTCRQMFDNEVLMKKLADEKFDIGIAELFDFSGLALFHRLNITNIIGVQTTVLKEMTSIAIGAPITQSIYPATQCTYPLDGSIIARIKNLICSYASYNFQYRLLDAIQGLLNEEYDRHKAPNLLEMISNMSLILSNSDPLLDFPKPSPFNVVDIGGFNLRQPKPLSTEWNNVLTLRRRTILLSFGSIAKSSLLPAHMKLSIIDTIKKFPEITFIWKHEAGNDNEIETCTNVILSKWMPQNDLLASGKISVFVTHGGGNSILEGAAHGVPLLVVPLFGDQYRNAQIVVRHEYGISYDIDELADQVAFERAIRQLLETEKYKIAAKKISKLISMRPYNISDRIVRSVKLAAEFGNLENFKSPARHLNFVQYYNLDILLILIFIIYISIGVSKYLMDVIFTKINSKLLRRR